MGYLLMLIGYGWALLGAVAIGSGYNPDITDAALGVLVIFNMVLFVLPGLVVGAVGQKLNRK